MAARKIRFAFDARERMLRGMDVLACAVEVTLGPKGRHVAVDRSFGAKITKDGVTVANEIELDDKFENMGAQLVRQVAAKTSYLAGDGTTTSIVLAHAMVKGGVKAVAAGMNPMDLKRGIDLAVGRVLADLRKVAKQVTSNEEIAQIATVSANGDAQIGRFMAEANAKVGEHGLITVEDGTSPTTELDFVTGIHFDRSFVSPHFITNRMKRLVELDNPYILLGEQKLANVDGLLPLLEKVVQANRPLLIVADDLEREVTAALVMNKLRGTLKVAAVKAPAMGELRQAVLQDIAVMTGGTVISGELGLKLELLTLDVLGQARKVTIDKQGTTILGGSGDRVELDGRIAEIRARLQQTTSDYDREKLQERLAKLTGGIAVLRVGGTSEIELRERKDRVRNAMRATRAAVEEGILPGGGVALLRASKFLQGLEADNDDQRAGIHIVRDALAWPARQIAANAGVDASLIAAKILAAEEFAYGYDAQTNEFADLVAKGIVDPAKVVRSALQAAASVAGILIMTEAMIAQLPGPPPPELPGHHDHHDHLDMEF